MALRHYLWSLIAANNASADPAVNWAEGQAPSSVNDSARAMMASAAAFRDDISGSIVTTGSGSAYAVSSNQVFDTLAHMNGHMVAFVAHATNTSDAITLNVDGLGAKPLQIFPGLGPTIGSLVAGTPYMVTYNNSDGAFYIFGRQGNPQSAIPLGTILPYAGTTAPNSYFAIPLGQAISRTTYAGLFSLISTTYGVGDGSTTFNLPDLGGRIIAGKEATATRLTTAGGGVDGGTLGSVGGAQNGTIAQANLPAVTLATTITESPHTHGTTNLNGASAMTNAGGAQGFGGGSNSTNSVGGGGSFTVNSASTGITASTALGGSGTAFKLVQPTLVLNNIIRVL